MTSTEPVDLGAYGGDFTADPYPVYAALRAQGPVHFVRTPYVGDVWLVVGYEEARAALADARLSKDWRSLVPGGEPQYALGTHMLESDPPRHTRLRKLVAREFTARRVEALRPRVERITDDLLAALPAHGTADLLEALAFPLPMTVICELLGVPDLDRTRFRAWSQAVVGGAAEDEEAAAVAAMNAYLVELVEDKRCTAPADDLLSALIRTRTEDGDRLSSDELVGMAFLLLVAGHETTVNLIGNGMLALFRHPGQLAALRADMGLLDGAVEEMLRYDGPVETATWRFTVGPVDIGGTVVPPGAAVGVVLAAADRDPARYPEPDTFDIRRPASGHLAFGHGLHYCLGAPLARLEGKSAFAALLARYPDLALAADPRQLTWRPGPLMRGVHRLPVTF